QLARRDQALGDDEAADPAAAELAEDRAPLARLQLAQVAGLAAADDLHAAIADVVGVAGEREPGPLDARLADHASGEPRAAAHHLEPQRRALRLDELEDRHTRAALGFRLHP